MLQWFQHGFHASMHWMEKRQDERGDILKYFPGAKTVISVGMNYYNDFDVDSYKISRYARGDDYHNIIKKKLFRLLEFVQSFESKVKGVVCIDTSPVMEKVWAQRAGLGWQGKHTNLITSDYGSWIFLGELVLDIELEPDAPFEQDLCGTCTACEDACPTQALSDGILDSNKCISYLTIEHRGELPAEFQGKFDNWIYGCDICQEVCPWNHKSQTQTEKSGFYPRKEITTWKNKDWDSMSEDDFRNLFKGSAVKRTKFSGLKRNIKFIRNAESFTKK